MTQAADGFLPPPLLALADVDRAYDVVRRYLAPTPLRPAYCLRDAGDLLLKLECWQPTGSYKVRGALSFLAALDRAAAGRGVVAPSAGNHALGLAFAASALGMGDRLTLFLPETAPLAKVEKLRTYRVALRQVGTTYDEAQREARAFAERTGAALADPVEDPVVAAGHGTLGFELLEQRPDLAAVVVPVGGGALVTGVATAVRARSPRLRIVGVQAQASPALVESLRVGRALVEYDAAPTLADGLAGGIGELVFRHRHLIDEVVTVGEDEIAAAMAALLAGDQVVSEGAGAVGVAAILAGKVRIEGPVAVLVTGANVDAAVLARILQASG